jgi:hypothetical protein
MTAGVLCIAGAALPAHAKQGNARDRDVRIRAGGYPRLK